MILNKRIFFLAVLLCVFIMLAPGCKDKTTEQGASSVVGDITISMIKENRDTLNLQDALLKASIVEFKDVKNYTYLNLEDSTGQIWAALPKIPVEKGQEIEISNIIVMKDFNSKTLDKTFDVILFAVPSTEKNAYSAQHEAMPDKMMPKTPSSDMMSGGMPPDMMSGGMPPDMMSGGMPPDAYLPGQGMMTGKTETIPQNIKVSKAEGKDAYTIEEIYSKKETLKNNPVRVRAKIVKFLPNIMGKNWIHIQDGTGKAEDANYDITVAGLETANVGDEVIVYGTLAVNKDLGSAHTFAVIIEDASIQPAGN